MLTSRGKAALIALFAMIVALTACTTSPPESPEVTYPEPDGARPVVDLAFTLDEELVTIAGTETVTFTPDQQICEVMFRAWPNKPATARRGNSLVVDSMRVDGTDVTVATQAAGAPDGAPGTLVTAALPSCVPAGNEVTAELAFTVQLGARTDERMGVAPPENVAWFGSAFPVLAWVRGHGWQQNPAVDAIGEMAATDAFRLNDLAVTVPSNYRVAGVGETGPTENGPSEGTTTHHFAAEVVRDVSVTVGDLDITQITDGDVPITVVRPVDRQRIHGSAQEWAASTTKMLTALEQIFGTYPYERVWVNVLPGVSDGVEYGESFQITGRQSPSRLEWLIAHELAHAWFYGLVGNNQGVDPWLDESFATYGQELVSPTDRLASSDEYPGLSGRLGEPMAWWASGPQRSQYESTVYSGGAWILLEARQAVGAEQFDALIRAYLQTNAHGFVVPADLRAALEPAPEAVRILEEAGAWAP